MANRYNQYQKIDYVGLPVDAYAQAAGSMEQENLMKLQETKSIYDGMQNVEASYNPDRQLKAELLNEIQKQIAEVASKNLKGNDALLQLSKIVNNRDTVDKLANIYGNTVNYKSAMTAQKKYQDDYGNDINIQQGTDAIDEYNKLDSKGFKPGMMQGYTPGKFLDIVGDAQKLLKDSKGNSVSKVWHNKQWMYKKDDEFLTEEMLLEKAMPLFNDPKYATQLKNLQYYGLKKYGNNPQEALANYNTNYVTALNTQISDIAAKISEYDKLAKEKPRAGYQQLIEKGKATIAQLSAERDLAKEDKSGEIFSRNLKLGLAKSALSPYTYSKESLTEAVNPYGLAGYKSSLAFGNWEKQYNRKREDEKKDAAFLEFKNRPIPTMQTVTLNGVGGESTVAAFQFDAKGGFDPAAAAETIAGALNRGFKPSIDAGTGVLKGMASLKDSETLKQGIASGKYQAWYIPASKEYMISDGDNRMRVAADLGMQETMDPVYQLYNPNRGLGSFEVNGVSLDGINRTKVIGFKSAVNAEPLLFAPTTERVNIRKIDQKIFGQAIGMDLSKDAILNSSNGLLVVIDGWKEANNDGVFNYRKVMTKDEYDVFVKSGGTPLKYQYVNKSGDNIEIVDPFDPGEHGYKIAQSHLLYHTQKGGQLRNLLSKQMDEKEKNTTVQQPDAIDPTKFD